MNQRDTKRGSQIIRTQTFNKTLFSIWWLWSKYNWTKTNHLFLPVYFGIVFVSWFFLVLMEMDLFLCVRIFRLHFWSFLRSSSMEIYDIYLLSTTIYQIILSKFGVGNSNHNESTWFCETLINYDVTCIVLC